MLLVVRKQTAGNRREDADEYAVFEGFETVGDPSRDDVDTADFEHDRIASVRFLPDPNTASMDEHGLVPVVANLGLHEALLGMELRDLDVRSVRPGKNPPMRRAPPECLCVVSMRLSSGLDDQTLVVHVSAPLPN